MGVIVTRIVSKLNPSVKFQRSSKVRKCRQIPVLSNGTQITEEPTFSKTRVKYPTFDLIATSETSSAPCQLAISAF